jgi:hypothetical protein
VVKLRSFNGDFQIQTPSFLLSVLSSFGIQLVIIKRIHVLIQSLIVDVIETSLVHHLLLHRQVGKLLHLWLHHVQMLVIKVTLETLAVHRIRIEVLVVESAHISWMAHLLWVQAAVVSRVHLHSSLGLHVHHVGHLVRVHARRRVIII